MISKSATGATQVRAIGSNVVTSQVKPGAGMQMATVGGKQTIVINKPGGGQQQIVTVGGQEIIASGMKIVQHMTTSQAGAGM